MYHAEQKTRFIKDYSTKISVRDWAKSLFERIQPFEEERGADFCTFDLETTQQVFESVASVSKQGRGALRSVLRGYCRWCREHGVEGVTDATEQIDVMASDAMRRKTVRNPRHLQAFLDVLCVPESEQTSDNNFRSYYWLAYSGLGDEEIFRVTTDEVDFLNAVVRHGGREYPIYREAVPALRNCVELSAYRYLNPNYTEAIWRDRVPGNILLRGVRSTPTVGIIRVDFAKREKKAVAEGKTDMQLSYRRIWLSGVFYRMYEDELAGFQPDFSAFIDERLGDFQYAGANSQEYKRRQAAEAFRTDYERWKETLIV
jgi:hypothetical protein